MGLEGISNYVRMGALLLIETKFYLQRLLTTINIFSSLLVITTYSFDIIYNDMFVLVIYSYSFVVTNRVGWGDY